MARGGERPGVPSPRRRRRLCATGLLVVLARAAAGLAVLVWLGVRTRGGAAATPAAGHAALRRGLGCRRRLRRPRLVGARGQRRRDRERAREYQERTGF